MAKNWTFINFNRSFTIQIGDTWLTVCVGGSSFAECSTWELVNNLMICDWTEKADLWLEDIKVVDTFIGANFTYLNCPRLTVVAIFRADIELLLYGGMVLGPQFCPTNNLYAITINSVTWETSLPVYSESVSQPADILFRKVVLQGGEVPTARLGHTTCKIAPTSFYVLVVQIYYSAKL